MPWYVAGAIIGLIIPAFLLLGNRQLGVSSTLRHLCAAALPTKAAYFKYEWRHDIWNLMFALGLVIGGVIGGVLLPNPDPVQISMATKEALQGLGVVDFAGLAPRDLFSLDQLLGVRGVLLLCVGGFLVGFGTRWANGCTSGHGIMGLSLRNFGSLVAVIGFFLGGVIGTWVLLPFILSL